MLGFFSKRGRVGLFFTKTMTEFNKHKLLPDKEGGNFLFCTVYWGVQI